MVGDGPALQIQGVIKNAAITGDDFTAVISVVILVIAATTSFNEMQDSLNKLWNLKVKEGSSWKLLVRKRLLAFSMVVVLGLILLGSLVLNSLMERLMNSLPDISPRISVVVFYIINLFLTLFVVTILFGIIFKLLPDVIIIGAYRRHVNSRIDISYATE